jgi:starch synthase
VVSLYNDGFKEKLSDKFLENLQIEGLKKEELGHYNENNFVGMMKSAIDYSDAVIIGDENVDPELKAYAEDSGKPVLQYVGPDEYLEAYNKFYDELLETKED